ncbi:MAG: BCSC C-terminal domain-containing protein [Burkholderiaceae bacterium]|nr:BCSC C-terminal domain-containing protein [Burkholderiaceae bacterium]
MAVGAAAAPAPRPTATPATGHDAADGLLQQALTWQARGRNDLARATLRKRLAARPDDPRALQLLAELELQAGRDAEAAALIERLQRQPAAAENLADLRALQRLHGPDRQRLAELRQLRRGGRHDEALERARSLFPDGRPPGSLAAEFAPLLGRTPGGWLRMRRQLAERVQQLGAPADRLALYDLLAQRPQTLGEALRGYATLARQRQVAPQPLADAWQRAASALPPAEAAAEQRRIVQALPTARLAAPLREEPPTGTGTAAASPMRATATGTPPALDALAAPGAGRPSRSVREQADALLAEGRPEAAADLLRNSLRQQPRQAWIRHDLARLLLRQGDAPAARALMQEGRALARGDVDMLHASALIEAAADRPAEAVALLEAILPAQRSRGQQQLLQRSREALALSAATPSALPAATTATAPLADARAAAAGPLQLALGTTGSMRSGAGGRSTLHALETSLRLQADRGAAGAWGLQLDHLTLDAGRLPDDPEEAGELGQLALPGATLPTGLQPRAEGLALGVDWARDGRRVDLGVSGLGLPVQNLVGGWSRRFDLGDQAFTVELSRRIETGGLLAWAGQRDPSSGQVWGGVTNTSVALRASRDLPEGWSLAGSLRLGSLRGRHVADNTAWWWRGSLERRWIDRPGWQLEAGLVAAAWRYAHNLSGHTWGHGGYYSPQRYLSLALPVEASGRTPQWRWSLRASVSRSWTREDDVAYFPTDAALQAAAGEPVHRGGRGGGFGRALRASVETDLQRGWVLGARLELERSSDYAPNRASLYLRRHFGGGADTDTPRSPQWLTPLSRR